MSQKTKKAKEASQSDGVGIVLVTHGDFGRNLIQSAELILGPQDRREFISVDVKRAIDETVDAIRSAVESVADGGGVLVLTDLFGGSPTTLSMPLLKTHDLEVVTGVNLPMLIRAFQDRKGSLAEVAANAREAGMAGIKIAGEMLKRKVAGS